jgi:hypothetical protein
MLRDQLIGATMLEQSIMTTGVVLGLQLFSARQHAIRDDKQ